MSNFTDFFPAASGGGFITNQLGIFNVDIAQWTDSNDNVWLRSGTTIPSDPVNYPNATPVPWMSKDFVLGGTTTIVPSSGSLGSVTFADNGNRILVASLSGYFTAHILSTPYDITTAGAAYSSNNASPYFANDLSEAIFDNEGNNYYFNRKNQSALWYKSTSNYNVGQYVTSSAGVPSNRMNRGFWFAPNNQIAFTLGTIGSMAVSKYTFTNSTLGGMSFVEELDLSTFSQIQSAAGIVLNSTGTVLLIGCSVTNKIYDYILPTPFSLIGAKANSSFDITLTDTARISMSGDGTTLIVSENTNVVSYYTNPNTIAYGSGLIGMRDVITEQTFTKIN